MSFSKRYGFKEPTIFQKESMNEDLKNSLWNVIYSNYFRNQVNELLNELYKRIWEIFFKEPMDTISKYKDRNLKKIKDFYFLSEWYEVYDFIEFLILNSLEITYNPGQNRFRFDKRKSILFIIECNKVLKRENAAYRIIDSHVTPITSDEEIEDIKTAYNTPLDTVNAHIKQALEHYSDRKNPDYRNSIKESISAVEALARKITNESSLDKAIDKIESKITINSQLKEGLKKIYHWTNGKDGIRHALMDDPNVSEEDARFMLVSCSAFVNYLVSKAVKADIDLK